MTYSMKSLSCDPAQIKGMSERLIISHYENKSAAMEKAKTDLKAAVDRSTATTSGSRAISATPALKGGRAVASVTLLTGQEFHTVEQPLE